MISIACTYSNSDVIKTNFNGTLVEAAQYFVGQTFNIGAVSDNLQVCTKVELI